MSWAVLICMHGQTAEVLIESVEMITGEQQNIGSLDFLPGENTEDLKTKYKNELKNLDGSEGVLILVDLFGGSPFNAAAPLVLNHDKMDLVTGVNIPMLLEILVSRDGQNFEGVAEKAKTAGMEGVRKFEKQITSQKEKGDEL